MPGLDSDVLVSTLFPLNIPSAWLKSLLAAWNKDAISTGVWFTSPRQM